MHVIHNMNMEKFFDYRKKNNKRQFTLQDMLLEVLDQIELASKLSQRKLEHNARTCVCNFIVNRIQVRDSLKLMALEEDQVAQEDFYWKI